MTIKTGDHVHHGPTGEDWVVAYVDGDRLGWCGWPAGEARLADCKLIKRCSDAEHVELLNRMAKGQSGDKRVTMARIQLSRIERKPT